MHGWPSSVWEFHRLIPLLRSSARVIVPSLPGYGFSGGRRASVEEMADALHGLMGSLGHSPLPRGRRRLGRVASAAGSPSRTRTPSQALHLYMMPLRRPQAWPESEIVARAALDAWTQEEGGYAHIQGTRPQTLAYGLTDSPVGLMSWIAEKFDVWTDCARRPGRRHPDHGDDLLDHGHASASSFWPYYARMHGGWLLDDDLGWRRLRAPLTFLDFPKEIVHVPRSLVEHVFEIERWETPDYGGHFPALEATDVLADSLRRFVSR